MHDAGIRGRRFRRGPRAGALAGRVVTGIVPGDHVCASFGSDQEHRAIAGRYARQAIRRSERFLYLAHATSDTTIRVLLEAEGIDVDAGLALGQIEIRRVTHGGRRIDAEAIVAALQADRRNALHDGYSALCVAAEMSWALARPGEIAEVVRYEHAVNRLFAAADIAAVCQYDRRLFTPDVAGRLVSAHAFRICTEAHLTTTVRRRLTICEHEDGSIALSGALDIDSSPYLGARLAASDHGGDLVVRTAGLGFADISGCRALVAAAESLGAGRRMVMPDAATPLVRVLELCGWSQHRRLVLG